VGILGKIFLATFKKPNENAYFIRIVKGNFKNLAPRCVEGEGVFS